MLEADAETDVAIEDDGMEDDGSAKERDARGSRSSGVGSIGCGGGAGTGPGIHVGYNNDHRDDNHTNDNSR